jgi:hypothetical protein
VSGRELADKTPNSQPATPKKEILIWELAAGRWKLTS